MAVREGVPAPPGPRVVFGGRDVPGTGWNAGGGDVDGDGLAGLGHVEMVAIEIGNCHPLSFPDELGEGRRSVDGSSPAVFEQGDRFRDQTVRHAVFLNVRHAGLTW